MQPPFQPLQKSTRGSRNQFLMSAGDSTAHEPAVQRLLLSTLAAIRHLRPSNAAANPVPAVQSLRSGTGCQT